MNINIVDPEIAQLITAEESRLQKQLQMIPSENFVSKAVREAIGSVVMNKYSEGKVGQRYYQGNENIDDIEALAKSRALELFGLSDDEWDVEVQAVTGAVANTAVYNALLEIGDKMLAMHLFDGGHLSHGWKMSDEKKTTLNSKIYDSHFYHVDPETEVLNYDEIAKIAQSVSPRIIISGGTAYPQEIDHKKLGQIAKMMGAYYLADVSHEAGLIAGGVNASPFEYADVVMMTTRKTLRGPNGALIFSRLKLANRIRRGVFPGMQGGPLNDHIAGIAVALKEALDPEFKDYAKQVVLNAQALGDVLVNHGYKLVSGGTKKHLLLVDLRDKGILGKDAAIALEKANIITNMNTVPNDASPMNPSGLRIGTPSLTSRGMKEAEMIKIGGWMDTVLSNLNDSDVLSKVASEVEDFTNGFPVER